MEIHFHEPHYWFHFLEPLGIDNLVIGEWLVAAVLIYLAVKVSRVVKKVPNTRIQGVFELLFDFLENWLAGFVGSREHARKYLPLLCTFFLFILLSNYSGLIPTAAEAWSFFPPTGKWGTTAGLGVVVMIAVNYISVKELGLKGHFSHLLELHYGPMAILMAPLRILEEFVRPFSLSLRLFGNIFAEEVLLLIVVTLLENMIKTSVGIPIAIYGLSLLFGAIQAVVFTTLTAIYIGGVVEAASHHAHHDHHHDHGGAHQDAHAAAH